MTPFEEILRRRRQRQAMDERLPDGRTPTQAISDPRDPSTLQVQPGYSKPVWESWDKPIDGVTGEYISYPATKVQPQRPTVLTATNQAAITRPRRALPQRSITWDNGQQATEVGVPESAVAPDESERKPAVSFNPATGRPNEDYYREKNDPAGLYGAYQNWQPHGGKRGFKNSLKAGALAAAQIAQNTDNPLAILTGFGVGAAGGAVNPDFKNKLVRGFKLQQVGGELKNQLGLQKEQATIDAAQMIPITLDNGQQVMVPKKSAGALQSRQQEIDIRGNTLEARKNRWDKLGEHEAARDAQALYNSGAADNDPELRAEIARRLRLPAGTALPPRGLGNQVKLDEFGNFVIVNPRSGEVTSTGTKSYETTKETGRNTRQTSALEAAKERVQMQQAGATQRTQMTQEGQNQRKALSPELQRSVAAGIGTIERIKTELSRIDADIKQIDDGARGRAQTAEEIAKLKTLGRRREDKVNEAKAATAELDALDPNNETGVGTGGYPYRQPRARAQSAPAQSQGGGKYTGRRISKANVAEYGRRHGMTAEQAAAYLQKEGASIY